MHLPKLKDFVSFANCFANIGVLTDSNFLRRRYAIANNFFIGEIKMKALVLAVALVLVAGVAQADDGQFEAGFEEGFKMVKGDWAILPIPPIPPITPIGSNDYREGLKAGIEAAQKR